MPSGCADAPACVTIDLDPTDDPTHGAQQLSFFNGHYDSWCYLPVMGFVSFNDMKPNSICARRCCVPAM
jgi:hypothetical protein